MSASICPGRAIDLLGVQRPFTFAKFERIVLRRYIAISGEFRDWSFRGIAPDGEVFVWTSKGDGR